MNKLGFMQGRLSPIVDNQIQAFPFDYWLNEFSIANKLGLSCMEWTLDYPKLRTNPLLLKEYQKRISNISLTNNISIPSVTLDCCMQKPFWKVENSNILNDLLFDFKTIIISANAIGAKILVLPLVDNGSINNESEHDILKEILMSFSDLLQINQIRIAFESDYEPYKLSNFINEFDSNLFGINYDIGNSASMGFSPKEEFSCYGKRIINVHIKDRILNGTTVRLGNGNADFEEVFNCFKSINYKDNFILQTARSKNNQHFEELSINISFIKKFISDFSIY